MPEDRRRGHRWRPFLLESGLILAILVAVSLLIRALDLDLRLARSFYRPGEVPIWWAEDRQPWEAIYRYGVWPANLIGALAAVGLIASLFRSVLRRYRRSFLFLLLALALGPGVVVNMVLKDHTGRPRPRQVVELGGSDPFLPVGETGIPGHGKSFPSGHAAMGFYLLSLYILWRNRRPRAARAFLAAGLLAGGLLGFQRIASGGHFLSDVVWSGGCVYLTSLAIDRAMPRERPGRAEPKAANPLALSLLGAGVLALALLASPYYRASKNRVGPLRAGTIVRIASSLSGERTRIGQERIRWPGAFLTIRTQVRGYGYFDNGLTEIVTTGEADDTLDVAVDLVPRGFFTKLRSEVTYRVDRVRPGGDAGRVRPDRSGR